MILFLLSNINNLINIQNLNNNKKKLYQMLIVILHMYKV